MQTITDLPKRAQVGFLLQIAEQLAAINKRYANAIRFSRSVSVNEPNILFDGTKLEWRFEFGDIGSGFNDVDESGLLVVTMTLKEDWLQKAQNGSDLLSTCFAKPWVSVCSCGASERSSNPCVHFLAATQALNSQLAHSSVNETLDWLNSCLRDLTVLGDELVNDFENSIHDLKPNSGADCRVQWRINEIDHRYYREADFQIRACIQKLSSKGKWTTGREVRDMDVVRDSVANLHPQDELLCSLLELQFEQGPSNGSSLLQILNLLKERPLVVWNRPDFPPVEFVETQPTVKIIDNDGEYKVEINIEGHGLKESDTFLRINRNLHLGVLCEPKTNRMLYYKVPTTLLSSMLRLQKGQTSGAKLSQDAALRVSTVLNSDSIRAAMRTELPTSLAGPEVPLPAKVQLHLMPRTPEGVIAQLRVACDAVEELPIPGIAPDRLQVTTAAGPLQYIRDLPAESQLAETYTNALCLSDYPYDGPYTWIAEDIPSALALIERAQQQAENGLEVCWPKSKPLSLLGEITPQQLRVRVTSQRDWFGMEGELVIDGLEIPLAELLAAIRRGGRYVQLASGQFATISEQLRKRLTMMDDVSVPEGKQLRVHRAGATLLNDSLGEDISFETDAKWQAAIERLTSTKGLPTKAPKGLKAELRDYQLAGYLWLAKLSHWGLGGCLADDMGLGKTVQALGVLLDRAKHGPTLIVAPTSVGTNWVRETTRFAPSLSAKLYREHNRDDLIRDAGKGDLIITSYQLLQRDAARFSSRSWGTLVLDESQYIKNFATKTNQSVRNIEADWCLAISGTPLENHLGELWSLMRIISPGLLGSWERFRKRFAEGIERDKDKERLAALSRMVRPFILRRTKSEVLKELPPRTEVVLNVELSPAERKKYDAARLAALADLTAPKDNDNEQKKRIRVLTWLMRLRQLACHMRLVDSKWKKSSAKLDQFMEVIEELRENGHRALVFSQFVQHLALVREALDAAQVPYQYLDGSTSPAKRTEAIDVFQAGEGDVFLISLKAGGTGVTLTAADYVLHLDPWWNPAVEDQATDRAHRIGQARAVTVYRLVTRDTIEEQILALHGSKRELMTNLLEGTDSAGKMSTEELVNLIRVNQVQES